MLTSEQLKNIRKEARPLIEQQLELAEKIAGFRELVSSHGGDWGQLKALIKAQIQDENDDEGDGKRVRKILDKADYATAYADMLGLAKMNEKNSFVGDDHETTEPAPSDPKPETQAADAKGEGPTSQPGTASPSATHEAEHSTVSSADFQREPLSVPVVSEASQDADAQRPTAGSQFNTREGAPATEGDAPPASSVVATNIVRIGSGKPLRPFCQHLDDLTKCGGYGKTHCGECLAAMKRLPVEAGGVEIEHGGLVS